MKQLLVIAGPTAIGKTATAIKLAQRLETEIVSCDSRQFYRELDIGVARPTADELAAAPHHFIACRTVSEPYNAWQYEQDALQKIGQLFENHNTVIAVGGSGLYIDALCKGIDYLPDPAPEQRQRLQAQIAEGRLPELLELLRERDPDYYAVVDRSNPIRIQRALEVCLTAGVPYSQLLRESQAQHSRPFQIKKIALDCERATLRDRIDRRTALMLEQGLVAEVERLVPYRHLNTLNTVGYKELFRHLDGECTLAQAETDIRNHTWQYAKKQITWLKRYTDITWVPCDHDSEKMAALLQVLR